MKIEASAGKAELRCEDCGAYVDVPLFADPTEMTATLVRCWGHGHEIAIIIDKDMATKQGQRSHE